MALLQVKTSFNIDLHFETSPFHLRLLAWSIDSVLVVLYMLAMSTILGISISFEDASELGLTELLVTTPYIVYHFGFELLLNGQSPGKMIMKIKVVALNGQSATVSQYLLRWLLRFVDFGLIMGLALIASSNIFLGMILGIGSVTGFILMVSTKYNQRIGDFVAGTAVVMKKLPYNLNDTIFQELDLKSYKVSFPDVMRLSDKDINIVDNIVKQHHKSTIDQYVATVANKIKSVLQITTEMPDDMFLETLLRDYNYLSRK